VRSLGHQKRRKCLIIKHVLHAHAPPPSPIGAIITVAITIAIVIVILIGIAIYKAAEPPARPCFEPLVCVAESAEVEPIQRAGLRSIILQGAASTATAAITANTAGGGPRSWPSFVPAVRATVRACAGACASGLFPPLAF